MSESRLPHPWRVRHSAFARHLRGVAVTATALLSILTSLATLPLAAAAQSSAELQARRDSLALRMSVASARLDSAEDAARAVPDDSVLVQGAILRFRSANLSERDRARLIDTFDAAASELEAMLGPDAKSLMAGQVWQVTVARSSRRGKRDLALEAIEGDQRVASMSSPLPLRADLVKRIIFAQAGQRLLRLHPALQQWLGGNFNFPEPETVHHVAQRELALHGSSVARSCARGVSAACVEILEPAPRDRQREASDSSAAQRPSVTDAVRMSVLRYAISVDGPSLLRALRAPADSLQSPWQLFAAAGQPTDQLLRGWNTALRSATASRIRVSPPSMLTAVGWFSVCGFLATRRRPQ